MAAVLVLAACGSTGSAVGGDAQAAFVTGKRGIDTVPLSGRHAAPDVGGDTLDGGHAALADYRGKVVVLNLWASWCSSCRAETEGLEQVYGKYRDQGVQFLGINTRDTSQTNAQQFEQLSGITYPSLYDPDGTQILKFPKGSLNPQSIPTTIVIDRQGRIAARAMKALPSEDLESMLTPILAER